MHFWLMNIYIYIYCIELDLVVVFINMSTGKVKLYLNSIVIMTYYSRCVWGTQGRSTCD